MFYLECVHGVDHGAGWGVGGKEQRKTFYNLEARCIQHEMDHLDGKLCIDYEKGEYSRDKHKSQTMVESDFRAKSNT